jgi:hypothetical protein
MPLMRRSRLLIAAAARAAVASGSPRRTAESKSGGSSFESLANASLDRAAELKPWFQG